MIKISVASYNNTPSAQVLAFTFDELGGTIGRGDTNQLILPDPERSISRVHAQVVYRNGRFSLIDKGSNPVSVNGRALGNGAEAPIQVGDQIQIGGYLLVVETGAAAHSASPAGLASSSSDPFSASALMGGAPTPMAAKAPAPNPNDPFAGFWAPPASPAAASPAPAASRPAASPPASGGGGIPTDWDPFGTPAPAPAPFGAPPAAASASSDPFGMFGGTASAGQMAKSSESSLDNLFGLGAPSGSDPFSNSPLGAGMGGPNTAADLDPLRALGQTRDAGFAAVSDQGSDLNTPFMAPKPAPSAATGTASAFSAPVPPSAPVGFPAPFPPASASPAAPAAGGGAMMLPDDFDFLSPVPPKQAAPAAPAPVFAPMPAPIPAPALMPAPTPAPVPAPPPVVSAPAPIAAPDVPAPPNGAVLSWGENGSADGRTVIKPKRPAESAAATPDNSASPPTFAPTPSPAAPQAAPAASVSVSAPTPLAGAAPSLLPASNDVKVLLDAFKEGLAAPTVQIEALTPEVMRLLGQLIHQSTQGTVDLLVARAALKREVRAEITMIVAQKNNPLKFSPSVEVALGHLMSPPQRGFMPAAQAMQDAYDDLRAHQFGFMAGMKAALDGVLKRFDPALLEGKLTQKSVLSSLLPATRKAKMWEVFQELYAQISAEASDDFHELFGKEFLKAYEAHIDELHNERARGPR